MDAHRRERGLAVLSVLFFVLILGGLALGVLEEGLAARTSMAHHESSLKALEVAEAGVVHAEQEIRAQTDSASDGVGFSTGTLGGGTWSVTAGGDAISADRSILRSTGTDGHSTRRIEVGIRRRADRYFVEALFSQSGMVLNGNTATDAYDSSKGTYASQAVNTDAGGAYAQAGGHIGSNADIVLTGSSVVVRGNAIPGPLQEVDLNGGPTVLGDMAPREFSIDVPPVPLSAFTTAMLVNDNMSLKVGGAGGGGGVLPGGEGAGGHVSYNPGDMSLSVTGGATCTLKSGVYFFSDVRLTGNSILRIEGSVTIYVTGSLDLGGGTLVNEGRPQDLQVYGHPYQLPPGYKPSSTSISLAGGSGSAMAIYAPAADVDVLGGSDFFGSIVAGSIDISGGGRFHYDSSLGSIGASGTPTLERLYWRDLTPPRR